MTKGISRTRKAGVGFLAALMATAGVLIPFAPGAGAAPNLVTIPYSGTDRFDTARLIAQAFGASPNVVIARGDVLADALSGGYVAGVNNAAILLVRTNEIPASTSQALTAAGANRALIMGGTAAVSEAVATQLRNRPMTVERYQGATRYETAADAATRSGPATGIGTVEGKRTALVARGDELPDALSGGPLAFNQKFPVILTPGGPTSTLHPAARGALSSLQITNVYVLGGDQAVSNETVNNIQAMGISVNRLAGAVRTSTSVRIAEEAITKFGFTTRRVGLARGDIFPDALAYAPLAGKLRPTVVPGDVGTGRPATGAAAPNPVILASGPNSLGQDAKDYLIKYSNDLTELEFLGGEAALSPAVRAEAEAAARSGGAAFSFSNTSTTPGGTISGTVSGQNIQSVTVQGCGITTPQTLSGLSSTGGSFTVQIPASQPNNANCTLTFTTTFAGGRTETDTQNIAVGNAPTTTTTAVGQTTTTTAVGQTTTTAVGQTTTTTQVAASATGVSAGPQLATAAPDLLGVEILNGTPNDGIANQVRYRFDATIINLNVPPAAAGATPFPAGFNDPNPPAGPAFGPNPFSVQGYDSATRTTARGAVVEAGAMNVIATYDPTLDLRIRTIGTVDSGAVSNGGGLSTLASKALTGTIIGTAQGVTEAPVLLTASPDVTNNTITYTFDKAVTFRDFTDFGFFNQDGTPTFATGPCVPATGAPQTLICPFAAAPPVSAAKRYFVEDNSADNTDGNNDSAVERNPTTVNTGDDNVVQHFGTTTDAPDLEAVRRVAGQPNQVDFDFDATVQATGAGVTVDPTNFAIYNVNGNRLSGVSVATTGDTTVLRVTFPGGTDPNLQVNQDTAPLYTRAGVERAATLESASPNRANTTGGFALGAFGDAGAGFTDGPDLLLAVFQEASNQVTYHFDEDIANGSVNPAAYFLVLAGGGAGPVGQTFTISGKTVTINYAAGSLAGTVGAGVTSPTGWQNTVGTLTAATDLDGNVNSPDSVGRTNA